MAIRAQRGRGSRPPAQVAMSDPTTPPLASSPWWQQIQLREVALATITVLLVVLGFAAAVAIRSVLVGVLLGLLLATGLRPVMGWLLRARLPRPAAAGLALILLLALVASALAAVIPMAIEQVRTLIGSWPELIVGLRRELAASRLALARQLSAQLATLSPPLGAAGGTTAQLAEQLSDWAPSLERALLFTLSTLIFAYSWLIYRDRSVAEILLLLPQERRERVGALWEQIEGRIGAFVRGQFTLAAMTSACCLVGYWAIGLPYALVLALIAGMLEFIPFLGSLIATALACAVGLSVSPQLGLLALIFSLVFQQVQNNLLAPRIMAQAVGVNPVVTLLAFVGFTALFGPLGGLVAVPLAAVLQLLFSAWMERRSLAEATGERRDGAAHLRYQLADLTQDLHRRLRGRPDADAALMDDPEEQIEAVLVDLQALLDQRVKERP